MTNTINIFIGQQKSSTPFVLGEVRTKPFKNGANNYRRWIESKIKIAKAWIKQIKDGSVEVLNETKESEMTVVYIYVKTTLLLKKTYSSSKNGSNQ